MNAESRVVTHEQEFIKELNSYLEYSLGKHGENKVKEMLLRYRARNPLMKIVKITDPAIVANVLNRARVPRKVISAEDIIRIVSEYLGIDSGKFINVKCRANELVYARYLCMFFCKRYSRLHLKQIGAAIGGRDHTTVIHGCAALKARIQTEEKVKEDVENINSIIIAFRATLPCS